MTTPLFAKLNLKDQPELLVLNAPASFEPELALLGRPLRRKPGKAPHAFGLAFCITQAELDAASRVLAATTVDDPVLWVAYPKQSSKQYRCEFNRDSGWTVLGEAGFEGVRQVAIDADWSALRFRRVQHVKTLTRDPQRALSHAGKARTQGGA
jgi:hypothetical protein